MRKILVGALVVMCCGCNMYMNSTYSQLLDRTAATSTEFADRGADGKLTQDETVKALRWNADMWARFQNARDGVTGNAPGGAE